MNRATIRNVILVAMIATSMSMGAYVILVWRRVNGKFTTLGEDTIFLVYGLLLMTLIAGGWLLVKSRNVRKHDWVAWLLVVLHICIFASWTYLNLSGAVIAYQSWHARRTQVPVELTPLRSVSPADR